MVREVCLKHWKDYMRVYNTVHLSAGFPHRHAPLAPTLVLVSTLDPQSTPEYLHATLTDQRSGGASDLELRFLDGEPLISVRLLARNPTTTQPVCLQRGCINGNNAERRRLERLRVDNGFESEDDRYQVEKDWVPVFFH